MRRALGPTRLWPATLGFRLGLTLSDAVRRHFFRSLLPTRVTQDIASFLHSVVPNTEQRKKEEKKQKKSEGSSEEGAGRKEKEAREEQG